MAIYAVDRTALLIVDPYNDFMSEGGELYEATRETAEAVGFYDNMRKLVPAIRAARIQVLIVPHHRWREGDYKGWKHMNPSQVRGNEMRGFANTDLDAQLKQRGIENVILVGFVANTCIEATARFGMELGYHVTLIKDATAAFSQEGMHAAHEVIRVGADPTVWPVDRRMRPLVAHGQAGLANVYGRTGRHTEAEEHLRRATSLYEAMEMRFWLARAEEATRDQAPRRTR